jgi:hypothetical protein
VAARDAIRYIVPPRPSLPARSSEPFFLPHGAKPGSGKSRHPPRLHWRQRSGTRNQGAQSRRQPCAKWTPTNHEGRFVVPNLEPGRYDVIVQKPGFQALHETGLLDLSLKTRSVKKGPPTSNEIRFEDSKGQELFSIHAERDFSETVGANTTESVGGHRFLTVGANQVEEVTAIKASFVGQSHVKVQTENPFSITGGDRNPSARTVANEHPSSMLGWKRQVPGSVQQAAANPARSGREQR